MGVILSATLLRWAFSFVHRIAKGFKSMAVMAPPFFAASIARMPQPVPISKTVRFVVLGRFLAKSKESSAGS